MRPEVKAVEKGTEEERKREKPKAHAPSHAKIRSTGLVSSVDVTLIYNVFIFCGNVNILGWILLFAICSVRECNVIC